MHVVVVYGNDKGKISITKEELEKMLNEAYDKGYSKGYSDGRSNNWVSWGGISTTPYYGNISSDHTEITCDALNK